MRYNSTFKRAMEQKFTGELIQNGQVKSLASRAKFDSFRDELAKLLEKLALSPQEMTSTFTMNELFELRPDSHPFIDWLGCARTWKDSIMCENLTQIDSITSRKCTTLLHTGAIVYDAYNRPELFNASTEIRSSSMSYFDAKEVIKIVLDFEPEDYGDLKRQIGARVTFHSGEFVAAIGDLDFFVTRGYRYDFSIDRKDTKLIGLPYDKCTDYPKENIDKYKIRVEPRVPLAFSTCVQNCVIRNVLNKKDCWPPAMPYFKNDSLDPDLKVKFCPWFQGSHKALYHELLRLNDYRRRQRQNMTDQAFNNTSERMADTEPSDKIDNMRDYREITRFCWSKCMLSCNIVQYTVSVTRSAWPTDVEILFDPTGKMRAKRHCCALVAIKFTHFHYNIHEYKPKHEFIDTIGDLGGLLAFWLGLSIVSIYNALQKLVEFCSNRSINKIRDLQSSSRVNEQVAEISYWDQQWNLTPKVWSVRMPVRVRYH